MSHGYRRYFLFAALGFTALASQIIILRQLMIVFGGNELTVGIALASWMIWAGTANFVAGRFSDQIKRIETIVPVVATLMAATFPATILLIMLIKPALGFQVSEIIDLTSILFITIITLAPLCFMNGILLNLLTKTGGRNTSEDIGYVYLFDAIGAAMGGIVFGWFAIEYLSPFSAICVLSLILLLGAILNAPKKLLFIPAAVTACVIFFLAFSPSIIISINNATWAGFNPILNINSKYQNLVVTENRGEYTIFSDGLPFFTKPDEYTDETIGNLPPLEVISPKSALVIGGGISGIASQLAKHAINKITHIQIDPEVTKLETEIMGGKIPQSVHVRHEDGRYYLNRFNPDSSDKYDIIILNSGDPVNASTNRYFTEEFFNSAKNALNNEGIIFFGIYHSANYISDDALRLLSMIYNTLKKVFPYIVVMPLDRYYFAASASPGILTDQISELQRRLDEREIQTNIFTSETLYGTSQYRVDQQSELIKKAAADTSKINTDNSPTAYFSVLTLWGQKFGAKTEHFFKFLSNIEAYQLLSVVLLAGILSLLFFKKSPTVPVFWTLFAAGWCGISTELLILIKYQMRVGALFYMLGFIITAFMIGLSAGIIITISVIKRIKLRMTHLIFLCITLNIYIPAVIFISNSSSIFANFLMGIIIGVIYQTAAEVIIKKGVGRAAGIINGSDYMGAAAGSLITSILIIPLFGLNFAIILALALTWIATASITLTTYKMHGIRKYK